MRTYRNLISWILLAGQIAYVCIVWPNLPAVLPSHFALDGTPNRFAPKAILFFLLAVEAGVLLLLTIIERHPHAFNLPDQLGDTDRARQEALAVQMLGWMRLELAILFAYILWSIVNTAQHKTNGLGTAFVFLAVIITAATSGYYLRLMKKR